MLKMTYILKAGSMVARRIRVHVVESIRESIRKFRELIIKD
jgi:hypothetical protein